MMKCTYNMIESTIENDDESDLYKVIKGAFGNIDDPSIVIENVEGKRKMVVASQLKLVCGRHDEIRYICIYHDQFREI